jgi:thiol-disulfide isomerase/thioredoxin
LTFIEALDVLILMSNAIYMSKISTLIENRKVSYGMRILLSFMFLLSAVAKLYPSPHFALTTFEMKQLLPMGFSETSAAYFSRTLIGCELALGIGLLQSHYFKRLVLPLSFLILFLFSSQLTYELIVTGNKGNCGCFGSLLPMTPLQALIKNIVAMGLIGVLFKFINKENDKRDPFLITSLILASVLLVYLVAPLTKRSSASSISSVVVEDEALDKELISKVKSDTILSEIINKEEPKIQEETAKEEIKPLEPKKKTSRYSKFYPDIDNGKKILCFFAPGCDHCKETAKELTQLKKQIKDFPELRIIFMDEEVELIPSFFEYAGSKYTYQVLDVASFWQAIGGAKDTPGVIYLWNGNIIKEYDGINEKKFKMNEFKGVVAKPFAK